MATTRSGSGGDGIVVATSIPPKLSRHHNSEPFGEQYQKLCIQSWLECGFRIVSVNDSSEIPALSSRYPEVEFVATDRNASAVSGRKNPYIADLLQALANSTELAVGIVNSDILFEPRPEWGMWLPQLTRGTVVTGQRRDTHSLTSGLLEEFLFGFDYFFFDRACAAALAENALPYAMGLPWWDYWLPLSLALKGRRIIFFDRPATLHLVHEPAYDAAQNFQLARPFIDFVLKNAEALGRAFPAQFGPIHSLAVDLAKLGEVSMLEWSRAGIGDFAKKFIPLIRGNVLNLNLSDETAPETALATAQAITPAKAFANYTNRVNVGGLAAVGLNLTRHNRFEEAEKLFNEILAKDPNDASALYCAGVNYHHLGNLPHAVAMLTRATQICPNYAAAHSSLGVALGALGWIKDGIELLERSVSVDPMHVAGYFNLLLASFEYGGHHEVMSRFEKALAQKASSSGVEGYMRVRQKYRQLEGIKGEPMAEYYGQNAEDALLDEFFGFKPSGFFVDVGAFDGVYLSNSYVFEKRGWTGLCVEAAPRNFALCTANRPGSRCVSACAGAGSASAQAYKTQALKFAELEDVKVPIMSLSNMIGNSADIDFVSIDVKGAERDVLAGLDLKRHNPRILLLEADNTTERKAIDEFLATYGYTWARSLQWNHFYTRSEADRRALQAINVAAKLALPDKPVKAAFKRFDYVRQFDDDPSYVFWPA